MLFRIWIESREVHSLLLSQVEMGVGEGCSCTLTLQDNKLLVHMCTHFNNFLHGGDPGFHQCIPGWLPEDNPWGRGCQSQRGFFWCKTPLCCIGSPSCTWPGFRRHTHWLTCWRLPHLLGENWKSSYNCNSLPLGTANSKVGIPPTSISWVCSTKMDLKCKHEVGTVAWNLREGIPAEGRV